MESRTCSRCGQRGPGVRRSFADHPGAKQCRASCLPGDSVRMGSAETSLWELKISDNVAESVRSGTAIAGGLGDACISGCSAGLGIHAPLQGLRLNSIYERSHICINQCVPSLPGTLTSANASTKSWPNSTGPQALVWWPQAECIS